MQTWETERKKEENKKETNKDKLKKRGGPEKAKEKQRETKINKPKLPFLGGGGKQGFSIKNKRKEKQRKENKKHEEGLGPSEVALWATSPDP